MYREHNQSVIFSCPLSGLSLCVQGTCSLCGQPVYRFRFIPVHTGNMYFLKSNECDCAVYPCAYREHIIKWYKSEKHHGLSLCIQGTCKNYMATETKVRFIPVHTGNIAVAAPVVKPKAVYPCAYREHIIKSCIFNQTAGLSLCIQGT